MKRPALQALLLIAVIGLVEPEPAHAGFGDWIIKLSGPGILSAVAPIDYCYEEEDKKWFRCKKDSGKVIRGTLGFGTAVSNEPDGLAGGINVIQLGLSHMWVEELLILEAGAEGFQFRGNGFDNFTRVALQVGLHGRFFKKGAFELRIGAKLRYFFQGFADQDFGVPGNEPRGDELTPALIVGIHLSP